jgi:hypothetical protein
MIYRLGGMAAAVVFVAGLSAYGCADRNLNYTPAKGSVYLIDRTCDIIETETSPDGHKSTRTFQGDCKSADQAWDSAKAKHDKKIAGTVVVKVNYTAPKDGSYQTSELHFTARDDEFYDLKAGDEINILVRNDDPTKITKA